MSIKTKTHQVIKIEISIHAKVPKLLFEINTKVRFKRRIFHVPNAIQTIDNEIYQLINYCLKRIRHMKSSTFEPGLTAVIIW